MGIVDILLQTFIYYMSSLLCLDVAPALLQIASAAALAEPFGICTEKYSER